MPVSFDKAHELRIHALLNFEALILNLQKEILLAENIAQPVGVVARLVVLFLDHRLGHRALQTCGQGNQPFAVLRQQVVVNSRFVIETFQKSRRHKLD